MKDQVKHPLSCRLIKCMVLIAPFLRDILFFRENRMSATASTPKKILNVPSSMFELVGPVIGKKMLSYKCLLGCIPVKSISSAQNSRGNLKRNAKVTIKFLDVFSIIIKNVIFILAKTLK